MRMHEPSGPRRQVGYTGVTLCMTGMYKAQLNLQLDIVLNVYMAVHFGLMWGSNCSERKPEQVRKLAIPRASAIKAAGMEGLRQAATDTDTAAPAAPPSDGRVAHKGHTKPHTWGDCFR